MSVAAGLPKLIAVVRAAAAAECLTIVEGLVEAGVPGIEVTMTVPGAVEALAALGDVGATIGAGTVLDVEVARACIEAGARFIVSPVTEASVLAEAHGRGVPYVGGALSPSEIDRAGRAGCDAVKIFPISAVGGVDYLRAVREPLPGIRAVVSGGVRAADIDSYFSAGAVAVCLGGALIDRQAARAGDVAGVAARAAQVLASIKEDLSGAADH